MGGTMFNGLALVRELCAQGQAVTIVNRGKTQAELPQGVERLVCDRTDADAMRRMLERNVNQLPVLESDRLLGVVTRERLLSLVQSAMVLGDTGSDAAGRHS